MKFAFKIAKRYLSSRKEKSFVQKISNICIITVAVSIAVPILVLSVFGGFHKNVGNKIIAVESDIRIRPPYIDFTNYDEVSEFIENHPDLQGMVEDVVPYFTAYGIIKHLDKRLSVQLLAVPDEFYETNPYYREEMVNYRTARPELPELDEGEIFLGRKLINDILGAASRDVSVYVPISLNSLNVNIQEEEFEIAGAFISGYNKYEASLGIMRLEDVPDSFGIEDFATGLMVYLKNHDRYNTVINKLKRIPELADYEFTATQEEGLFIDFNREKGLMRSALIILVLASFMTIYITLNVVVLDKQKEIGIMKTFGVDPPTISRIFIVEGFLIGIIGAFIGVTIGMFMAVHLADIIKAYEWIASQFTCTLFSRDLPFYKWFGVYGDCKVELIPDNTFYITNMPSDPQLTDVLIQTMGAITAAVLAAYFPSARASKQKPIETLTKK
jgi:lipoprotein-releasing system permease protein